MTRPIRLPAAWGKPARPPASDPTPPREQEAGFQGWVIDLAERLGWRCHHTPDSRRVTSVATTAAGFPDLLLLHPVQGRLIVAELKQDGRTPRANQRDWLAWWRLIPGAEVYVWRPADRPRIETILRGPSDGN